MTEKAPQRQYPMRAVFNTLRYLVRAEVVTKRSLIIVAIIIPLPITGIPYIPTNEGWLYLATVLDLYSRTLLGWSLSDSLHSQLVIDALKRSLNSRLVAPNAIFHSDRGSQYSATSTRSLIHRAGLRQCMSAKGYCYDNAFAKSFFASLKAELSINSNPFHSKEAAKIILFDYLESFYKRKRLHSALDFCSPFAFLNLHFNKNIYLLN